MASKFWVGGTATWDGTAGSKWATTSGGAGGAAIPGTGDLAVFDSNSGAAVVTVGSSIGGTNTIQGITLTGTGTFGGTLDFSVNNPTITLNNNGGPQFSVTGSTARTVTLGTSTINFTNVGSGQNFWDATTVTNLANPTTSFASATFNVTHSSSIGSGTVFAGGGLTYGTLNVGARSVGTPLQFTGASTFTNLNLTAPLIVLFTPGATTTIANAIAWNGSSSNQFNFRTSSSGSTGTLAVASGSVISWAALTSLIFTGTTVAATNSFDNLSNTGVTITPPTGGGVIGVISG